MFTGMVMATVVSVGAQDGSAAKSTQDVKSVISAKTAIKGGISDATGETYGVVGVSNSPDGAGLGAANTNGGADLVIDGSAEGQPDAIVTQAGIDRPSASDQSFTLHNSGAGGLDLVVEGMLFGNGANLTDVNAALFGGKTLGDFALNLQLATSGSSSVHWQNITSAPFGLSDGDDDTLGGLSCAEDQIIKWNGAGWVCSADTGAFRLVNSVVAAEDAVILDEDLVGDVVFERTNLNGSRYGLEADGYFTSNDVYVNHCAIRGPTNSIRVEDVDVFVGGTQLAGGAVFVSSGSATCAGVWDESYTFYPSTCP